MTENLAVAVFRKFGAVATEWDPTNHDNQVETWGSMRARMDRAWPRLLAEAGVQETATRPTTLEEINPETQRRSVRRWARVLPVEVPRRIAAAADVTILGRELKYGEDEGFQ